MIFSDKVIEELTESAYLKALEILATDKEWKSIHLIDTLRIAFYKHFQIVGKECTIKCGREVSAIVLINETKPTGNPFIVLGSKFRISILTAYNDKQVLREELRVQIYRVFRHYEELSVELLGKHFNETCKSFYD